MRLSPALYVRQLLAKLYPPHPTSPRESQQLLNILESSFRRHLDETHPSPQQRNSQASSQHDVPLASRTSSSNATNLHLQSILTHPLVNHRIAEASQARSQCETAVERFQDAYVQGKLDLGMVSSCIKEYLHGAKVLRDGDEATKLGPRLAAWLYAAPGDLKQSFFLNVKVLNAALVVMAVDKEEEMVWEWLKLVYERDFDGKTISVSELSSSSWLKAEDEIVASLMRYSIRRSNLNDAAQQYIEACRYRQLSGRATANFYKTPNNLAYSPMEKSWKRIAASVILIRTKHNLDVSMFDALLQFAIPWNLDPFLNEPCLSLYHPTAPSAQLLCFNLRNSISAAKFLQCAEKANKAMSKAMLVTVLDGAQLSMDQGLKQDANFLLEFAQTNFRTHLPTQPDMLSIGLEKRIEMMWSALKSPRLSATTLELI